MRLICASKVVCTPALCPLEVKLASLGIVIVLMRDQDRQLADATAADFGTALFSNQADVNPAVVTVSLFHER